MTEGHKARTPSGEFSIYKGTLKGDIEMAGAKMSGHDIIFTDAVPYPGATPRGQIGSGGLADFTITLDARNRRIEFGKVAAAR